MTFLKFPYIVKKIYKLRVTVLLKIKKIFDKMFKSQLNKNLLNKS